DKMDRQPAYRGAEAGEAGHHQSGDRIKGPGPCTSVDDQCVSRSGGAAANTRGRNAVVSPPIKAENPQPLCRCCASRTRAANIIKPRQSPVAPWSLVMPQI